MRTQQGRTIWTRNFICILLTNFLMGMSNFSTNTLVSTYAVYLGAAPTLMGFLTGMFFGVALAMRPAAGPIQTRVNHRKLLTAVCLTGLVVNVGYALFHSIPLFIAFRVLHGIQYAFVGSLCMTIAADSIPVERLASGMGIFGVSSAVAQAIAPQIGISLRAWGTARMGEDFGYTALFLFAALMMLVSSIPAIVMRDGQNQASTAAAAATGKWYQNIISRHSILPALLTMLVMMSFSLTSGFLVPFGEEAGIAKMGLFFTVSAGAMLAIRPLGGSLTDRLGLRKLLPPAIAVFCAAFLVLGSAKGTPMIIVGALLTAVGFGVGYPGTQALSVQTEPYARRAVASNTFYIGVDIGFFFGPLLGGIVRDITGTYRAIILGGAVPLALALAVFFAAWPACERRIAEVKAIEKAAKTAES